jgi:hypothetical protein
MNGHSFTQWILFKVRQQSSNAPEALYRFILVFVTPSWCAWQGTSNNRTKTSDCVSLVLRPHCNAFLAQGHRFATFHSHRSGGVTDAKLGLGVANGAPIEAIISCK